MDITGRLFTCPKIHPKQDRRRWNLHKASKVNIFTIFTPSFAFHKLLESAFPTITHRMTARWRSKAYGDSRAQNDWIIVRKKKFESLDWRWKFISINDRRWQSAISELKFTQKTDFSSCTNSMLQRSSARSGNFVAVIGIREKSLESWHMILMFAVIINMHDCWGNYI